MIQEVPEINDGTVIIDKIVSEAGYRTKLTVVRQILKLILWRLRRHARESRQKYRARTA